MSGHKSNLYLKNPKICFSSMSTLRGQKSAKNKKICFLKFPKCAYLLKAFYNNQVHFFKESHMNLKISRIKAPREYDLISQKHDI